MATGPDAGVDHRRTMRDLVALSTLPAVWIGLGREGIARSLGDALLNILGIDHVFVRLGNQSTRGGVEIIRSRQRLDAGQQDAFKGLLARLLDSAPDASSAAIEDPLGAGMLNTSMIRFGIGHEHGVLVACSRNRRFPDERDRLLLGVGANQTAIVIQRQQAEEELRRSEQELSEFFENATIAFHWVGEDGTILRANRAELQMLGYERDEYVGRPISDFHVDQKVVRDILGRLKAGESLSEHPACLRCKDGSVKDVLIDSSVLWRDGKFAHTRCFTRDITRRKRAELELAETRSRLDVALEAGAIATWNWDIVNNRLFGDANLARLFNLSPAEAEGGLLEKYMQSIHPEDRGRISTALERCIVSGADYEEDYRILQGDGPARWVTARGRTERDAEGRSVRMAGVLVDITERKRLEAELKIRIQELAQADRRKDEFLATLAHELRNPLAPIRTSLEVLKMPRLDDATARQARQMMERQVEHLVRLVDDLLDVARVIKGKIELRRERLDLGVVIRGAVESAAPLITARGHRLELSLPDEPLFVDADPVRLGQVIGNVLTNAAKYTPASGNIAVVARRDQGEASLEVKDDGVGIEPAVLPHIFELFYQADPAATGAFGGLGIGLTLARNLMQMQNGSIEASSAGHGHGSVFTLRLPLQADQSAREPGEPRRQGVPADEGRRLLVVDDNEDAATSLAALLRLYGHEVRVAHDGPAAIAMATSFLPHMVFLDIGMPGMDGLEVARRLRERPVLRSSVLVALTGWGQEADRRRTALGGFDHHLVKPAQASEIERLLSGSTQALN